MCMFSSPKPPAPPPPPAPPSKDDPAVLEAQRKERQRAIAAVGDEDTHLTGGDNPLGVAITKKNQLFGG